jgi:antitoxin HicB
MRVGFVESKRVQRHLDRVLATRKNCSFDDIEALLLAVGFVARKTSGSHVIFKNGPHTISVPRRRPVKETYVEQTLELVNHVLRRRTIPSVWSERQRTMSGTASNIIGQPYVRELVKNEDGTWFARVVEFPGCMTEGDTSEEALANLEEAMIGWVEVRLEDGDSIPSPVTVEDYSGKFMVRVAKSLHRDIARRADLEGVSLNAFVSTQLARAVDR